MLKPEAIWHNFSIGFFRLLEQHYGSIIQPPKNCRRFPLKVICSKILQIFAALFSYNQNLYFQVPNNKQIYKYFRINCEIVKKIRRVLNICCILLLRDNDILTFYKWSFNWLTGKFLCTSMKKEKQRKFWKSKIKYNFLKKELVRTMPVEASSFLLTSRVPFSVEETELYELTELAGVTIDPKVFKWVELSSKSRQVKE